jgi:hypothetical protein
MKLLWIVSLAGVVFLANANNNKLANINSVCDECQEVVQSFAKLSMDQAKMASMKTSLSALCPKTKFVEECKVVASNLDTIVSKLLPYLKNSQDFCSHFHMCSNSNFDGLNRLVLAFINSKIGGNKDSICNDCQFAAHEILGVVADGKAQAQIHGFFDKFCNQLGQYQTECSNTVNVLLETLFTELQTMLGNNQQFCADLKLCSANQVEVHRLTANEMKNKLMGPKYVHNLLKSMRSLKTPEPHNLAMSCSECQIMADVMLDALKTPNATQMLSDDLVKPVLCFILPPEWGCDDFVNTYGTTVVYMTVEQFDSEGVCQLFQMCNDDDSGSDIAKLSQSDLTTLKCDSCKSLSSFMLTEMKKSKAKTEIVYGLQSMICKDTPQFLHTVCESFFGGLLPEAYDHFMHFLNNGQSCEAIKAC